MAATGKTPILLYGSTTATNVPVAGNLTNSSDGCEIAINVADKNLFFKDSTNAVNTVPIRQSSASSDGWLSSTDWSTFNSKQAAYTNLTSIGSLANATGWLYNNGSGTFSYSTPSKSDVGLGNVTNDAQTKAFIVPNTVPSAGQILVGNAGGTAYAPVSMSGDATLASTGAATLATVNSNVGSYTNASITVNAKGLITAASSGTAPVTSVTGTAPVVSSGGTTPAISMAAATGSVNGYLTSTDWTTFNSKQAALVSGTNIKTVSGTTLLGSGDLGTIGTGYGGTGLTSFTANGVVYASSTSVLTTGSGLTYTATGLGIGVSSATAKLDVRGTSLFIDNSTASLYVKNNSGDSNGLKMYSDAAGLSHINAGYGTLVLESGGTEKARLESTGNFTLASGNLVIGTSGKGIDFSATAGTGTSELLADYEEGTWTPTITYSVSNGDLSYALRSGYYTKIGRCVTFEVLLTFGETTASGYITEISGLPYTSAAGTSAGGGAYVDNMSGLTGAGIWVIGASTTALNLYFSGTGSVGVISNTNTGAASNVIRIAGFYYTT